MRRSRMFGWERNALRRRIDRVEAVMVAGLIAVFLVSAPVLAAVAGQAGMREQRAEAAWRLVSATVLGSEQRDNPFGPAGKVWMLARWTTPDGQARRGWIPVSPAEAAGSSARVWITRSGSLAGPPSWHSQVQRHTAIVEWVTALLLGLLLCLVGGTGRVLLARRRRADWNRAWRAVEPRWSRRR